MPGESVVGEGGTHADIMGSVHLKWLSVPLLSLVVLGSGAPASHCVQTLSEEYKGLQF